MSLALVLGATFVARSFSGDKKQLVPLIKAAIAHRGPAILDVISPCVQFNNHPGSTKSYDFVRAHNEAVNRLDFMVPREPIHVDYAPGTVEVVTQHDGSKIRLAKLHATTIRTTARRRWPICMTKAKGRSGDGAALSRQGRRGPARQPEHGEDAANRLNANCARVLRARAVNADIVDRFTRKRGAADFTNLHASSPAGPGGQFRFLKGSNGSPA